MVLCVAGRFDNDANASELDPRLLKRGAGPPAQTGRPATPLRLAPTTLFVSACTGCYKSAEFNQLESGVGWALGETLPAHH